MNRVSQDSLGELAARASALAKSVRDEAAFDHLRPLLHSEIVQPLDDLRVQYGGSEADDGARLRWLEGHLSWFERLAEQRRGGVSGERLVAADLLLRDTWGPLISHSQAQDLVLHGKVVAALLGREIAPEQSTWAGTDLVLVSLPPDFGGHPLDWDGLILRAAAQAWHSIGGMSASYYRRLGLQPQPTMPHAHHGYDMGSVFACFGAWLPALFSEILATLQLGAGHLAALQLRYSTSDNVTSATSHGAVISADAPAHLRMRAALAAAHTLGLDQEANGYLERWNAAHEPLSVSHLPFAGGGALSLDTEYLEKMLDELVAFLLDEPIGALDGRLLMEVPDLVMTPQELRGQEDLTQLVARGRPLDGPPRRVLGAALRALGGESEEAADPTDVLRCIERGLGQSRSAPSVALAAAEPAADEPAAANLGEALRRGLRSPRAWAEAAALQAAFAERNQQHR